MTVSFHNQEFCWDFSGLSVGISLSHHCRTKNKGKAECTLLRQQVSRFKLLHVHK